MKYKITIILLFFIKILSANATNIEPREIKVFREGNEVIFSFSVYIPEKTVRPAYRLLITPELYNNNGSANAEIFAITGSKMSNREKQKRRLNKNNTAINNYSSGSNGSTMLYTGSVIYQPWMENTLSLRLFTKEEGCCSEKDLGAILDIGPFDMPFPNPPSIPEIVAQPSEVTKRTIEYPFLRLTDQESNNDRTTSVRFRAGSSKLDLSFSSNADNANKIIEGINLVNNDSRTNLEKITISGFASPEGSNQQNMKLAENRAKALSQYLQQEMNIPETSFEIQSGGTDWAGLLELVKKSDMDYKEEIANIITNVSPEQRNERLKLLGGGRPYQSIYDVFYPQLRDACYINVWYSETKDKSAETINNAIALIATLRYEEALNSLFTVENDSRSWNVIGTCYLLQGDYNKAKTWLEKAAEAGDKEAEKNLNLIK